MREYGYKYKMSNLQAALGLAQIERVDELVKNKIKIFNWYKDLLKDLPLSLNPQHNGTKNSYWLPTVILPNNKNIDRNAFFTICKANGIDSRPLFYPLSSLPIFSPVKENIVAYSIYSRGINLPSFNDICFEEVTKVVDLLKEFINSTI